MNRKIPKMIEIEISNSCNLKCKICRKSKHKAKLKNMSFLLFKKIIDNYNYSLNHIQFCGTCEPLLNKDISKMIKYVVEKKKPNTVELISNGTLLDKKTSKKLIDAGLNMLRVSIDGPDNKTYFKIRGVKLTKTIKNLKGFSKLVKNKKIFFGINCVINSLNFNKILEMPEFVKKVGAKNLELRVYETNLEKLDLALHNKKDLKNLKSRVLEKAKSVGIKVDFLNLSKPKNCLLFDEVNIDYRGFITPCYHLPEIQLIKLGDKQFSVCWNSKKLKDLEQNIRKRKYLKECCCLKAIKDIRQ